MARGIDALAKFHATRLEQAKRNAEESAHHEEKPVRATPEAEQHGKFTRIGSGPAQQRKPVINCLRDEKKITQDQWEKLSYYREQALIAGEGGYRCPLDTTPRGGSDGRSVRRQSAICEVARIERDMGSVWDVARAIAVKDITIAKWCIEKHGGRERYDKRGRFIAMVPVSEKRVTAMALMEIKWAADRITLWND